MAIPRHGTQYKLIIFADYTDIQPKLKGKILKDSRSSIIKAAQRKYLHFPDTLVDGTLCLISLHKNAK